MELTNIRLDNISIFSQRASTSKIYSNRLMRSIPFVFNSCTTSAGHEGTSGQHIISWRSVDQGKTWIDKRDVEPGDGPEASYAVLLKAPSGRIFVFCNHNTDNIR